MQIEKEIQEILNAHQVRSTDPAKLKADLLGLVVKYSNGCVNLSVMTREEFNALYTKTSNGDS